VGEAAARTEQVQGDAEELAAAGHRGKKTSCGANDEVPKKKRGNK
jgi:hypothetical protein